MNTYSRLHDRRAANRPSNGDTAPCPQCRSGVLEFNARYRIPQANGNIAAVPAWICDGPDCHYALPARRPDRMALGQMSPTEIRARPNLRLMKTPSVVLQRAKRGLGGSLARKKGL
jgi:hypothetical protein